MLHGLASHILSAADLPAARDWYAGVLGQAPSFDQPFYVGFDVAGFELGILPAEDGVEPGGATAYWRVPDVKDVAAALARLEAAGATVLDPPTTSARASCSPTCGIPSATAWASSTTPSSGCPTSAPPWSRRARWRRPTAPSPRWTRSTG
jgi:catechol 2,3-dioxygenase-like lactoylglutathione lyase family enzyme